MKNLGKIAVCLAGGLMLSITAHANDTIAAANPYEPIVVRNVFGLNPPPTNAPPQPEDTPLKITPNGIMSIFGQLQVLYKVAPRAGKPGAKEESYMLSEGQSQDDIEVTRIDEKNAIITFNNHGTVQEIPLANAPALTTPMPAPGGPRLGQQVPVPGAIPTRFGGRPGGTSGGRFGLQNNANNYNNPNPTANPGMNPAMNQVPAQTSGGATGQQRGNQLSAEDQQLMMVAEHLKAQQEGSPAASIFPPTPFDAEAGIKGPPMPPGRQ